MTKTINDTYENFIKLSDKGFRTAFKKMGTLGDVILTADGGSGYNQMFASFQKDVKNKINNKQVRFSKSASRLTNRNPRIKRRSLMNRAT